MKQMIKFEVKRMLRNPGFYIAMMIGLIISVVHWIVWVLPLSKQKVTENKECIVTRRLPKSQ